MPLMSHLVKHSVPAYGLRFTLGETSWGLTKFKNETCTSPNNFEYLPPEKEKKVSPTLIDH